MDKETVVGWILVHRPFMILLVTLGSAVGYLLVTVERGIPVDAARLTWGLLSVALVCAGTDVSHEALDAEVDAINKPYRPVPRGLVKVQHCYIVAFWEFALGLIIAAFISIGFAGFLAFITTLTTHYSFQGKFIPFVGQLESTIGSAMVPFSGAVIHGDVAPIIPLCVFIFLFEVGRWFMVNIEDMEADLVRGRTSVHVLGKWPSGFLGLSFYCGSWILTLTEWFRQDYSALLVWGSAGFSLALVFCWGVTGGQGHPEKSLHLWHRNIARVLIVAYQVVLVTEVFV